MSLRLTISSTRPLGHPDVPALLESRCHAWAHNSRTELARATPRRTGATAEAWTATEETMGAQVSNSHDPPLRYLLEGTHRHQISATEKGALRFLIGDAALFRRTVQHPGTKPAEPLLAALERVREDALGVAPDAGHAVVRALGGF